MRVTHFLFCLLLSGTLTAQTTDLQPAAKKILINGKPIDKNTGSAALRDILGAPSRVLSEDGNPTRLYIYDQHGFAAVIDTVTNELHKIDFHLQKGKRSFETNPKTLFKGPLSLDGKSINLADDIETIQKNTGLSFEQMGVIPWYTYDNEEFSITFAYGNEKGIKMLHVIFLSSE